MVRQVEAVYEKGSLRLLEPVELQDGEKVTVTISNRLSDAEARHINEVLDRIASLADPRENEGFSGRDHDQVLYGKPHGR
jgi:predicted DNA-binding antitoxin AbrB/MazE fold protein